MREEPKTKAKVNEPVQKELNSRRTFHGEARPVRLWRSEPLRSPSDRDSTYAELAPVAPTLPKQGGRRGKLTALQKWQRWVNLTSSNPAAAKTYYRKHGKDIRSIKLKPNEVYTNTPVEREEVLDPMAQYDHAMQVWRGLCQRRRDIRRDGDALLKKRNGVKRFTEHCKRHPDVYEFTDGKLTGVRPAPVQPVEPEGPCTIPPKLDGRSGIRKQVADKSRAITSIDERMAEERRKAKAAKKEEPAPVMRHHTDSNPWLHAKHARNK